LNQRDHQRRRRVDHEGLNEATAYVSPAANLDDAPALIERVVAAISIRLQRALKGSEEGRGAVALMRGRRVEDDLARERIEIGPEATLEAAAPLVKDGDRRVIGLEIVGRRDLPPQLLANGRQRGRHVRDPATQGTARQIDALPREDAFEAVQGEVVHILRDDDMGEETFAGERFLHGLRRGRGFDDPRVTARTRIFRADRFDDDETRGFVFEFFGTVFADARPRLAARALLLRVGQVDLDPPPRQMRGQRPPPRGAAPRVASHRRLPRIHFHGFSDRSPFIAELFQGELELPRIDAFGLLPEQPLTQDVEFMAQRGNLALRLRQLVLQRGNEGTGGGKIVDAVLDRSRLIHLPLYTISG